MDEMKANRLVLVGLAVAGLAACDGGGINLNVETNDSSCQGDGACQVNNTGGGGGNTACASYTDPLTAELVQGSLGGPTGTQCVYGPNFVGASNPLTVDVTIPAGTHIFSDSLFVGEDVSSGTPPAEGEGPTLTIAPGATLVFQNPADYVLITRGARIIADGLPTKPIVFTSFEDAISDTAGANDVQQWGGLVINGNGITNNCTDAEREANNCHVTAEGQPSTYGGNNNAESSGTLRYVIVKHSGFEVAPGDELNGITFNAVGSGTIVENVQVYSTYDDGMEFFGGAVSPKNVVVLYARDDSLDYSDGYVGTIENALIIHWEADGNRCIEGDNIGSGRSDRGEPLDTAPISEPTVIRMTCINSNMDEGDGGTHGDSEGVIVRQGGKLRLQNSIIYTGYGISVLGKAANESFEIDDNDNVSRQFAQDMDPAFRFTNVLIASAEATKDSLPNGDSIRSWVLGEVTANADYSANTANFIIDDDVNAGVLVSGSFYTAASFTDGGVDIGATAADYGAVTSGDDWTSPWAFGLRPGNADQPLWFAP
jgi:hypothetical protein